MDRLRNKQAHKQQDEELFFSDCQEEDKKQSLLEIDIHPHPSNRIESILLDHYPKRRGRPRKIIQNTQITQATYKKSLTKNLKKQQSQPQPTLSAHPYPITKTTFHKIYFQFCQSTSTLTYSQQPAQNSLYSQIFTQMIQQLKYRQSIRKTSSSHSKIRSQLIRKVIEQFIRLSSLPQSQTYKKQSLRMTSSDKKLYQKANIQIPPSLIPCEYIERLFQNERFNEYYKDLMGKNEIRKEYLEKCYEQVIRFIEMIEFIGQSGTRQQRKYSQLKKAKKPICLSQVRQFEIEAWRLYHQHCK